ncbi:MAG: dethiobiotin synthase [Wenzhouxiangellaceae bacterium]|nr:dethiobiotin synthase [Wenzhouxiangellaceae bacterium]
MSTLFVTGTDTGCGKTVATVAMAQALAGPGRTVACFKPIASGCRRQEGRWVNDDALALQAAAGVRLPYETVNRYALEPPIAPHIAAARAGLRFDLDAVAADVAGVDADVHLVEGVGGWMVPLDAERSLSALPERLGADVVLVVGLRLGCLNHALLTARCIAADGLRLVGWVANRVDPAFEADEENLETLAARLPCPLLGTLPHAAEPRFSDTLRVPNLVPD